MVRKENWELLSVFHQLSYFSLNYDIFSLVLIVNRDKFFMSPKSLLDIGVKQVLVAIVIHILESQE